MTTVIIVNLALAALVIVATVGNLAWAIHAGRSQRAGDPLRSSTEEQRGQPGVAPRVSSGRDRRSGITRPRQARSKSMPARRSHHDSHTGRR